MSDLDPMGEHDDEALCPACGSVALMYNGAVDGTAVCDQWRCEDCGYEFEGDCIGGFSDDEESE